MTRRLFLLLFASLALAVGATACGGDDDDGEPAAEETATHEEDDGGEGTHLQLAADPSGAFAFDQTSLSAPAGDITIELTNDSSVPHNVEIEGDGVSETITGDTTELMATLEAGEYVYFCNLPGHREGGMEGTLTVE